MSQDTKQVSVSEILKNIQPLILKSIVDSIQALKFGSVEIIVHDSKVVQIERKEKIRFS